MIFELTDWIRVEASFGCNNWWKYLKNESVTNNPSGIGLRFDYDENFRKNRHFHWIPSFNGVNLKLMEDVYLRLHSKNSLRFEFTELEKGQNHIDDFISKYHNLTAFI
jgi:hypothetical protein